MPWWLGGRDRAKVESDKPPDVNVPGNRLTGVVHLVNDLGHFVLVKSISGRRVKVMENTIWMSYDANGRPSAKLKVSAERKGVFVVADIIEGRPNRGDSVVLHGLMDKNGKITTVTAPGSGEKQILE